MGARLIVIDTNFLLLPFRYKINIVKELDHLVEKNHQLVLSSRTIEELGMIGKKVGKDGMAARLAIKMIEAAGKGFMIVKSGDIVDEWIVRYASENNAMVCTNDSELRRRLKALKIKVVTMKSKSKIGFV
jgi:rRNA-processing protein FCF1